MRKTLLIWLLLPALLLTGCTKEVSASDYALPSDFSLPQKTIYGLGEATHGSAEFTIARQKLLEYLALERGVGALCLEEDFNEVLKINHLLYGDDFDAEETAQQFGMWIFRHRATTQLLQWMRDHNSSAPLTQQVRLYGIDCQYWDKGYTWLAAYLEGVSPGMAEILKQEPFSGVSDSTLYSIDPEEIGTLIDGLDALQSELRAKEAALAGQEYDVALRVVSALRQSLVMVQAAPDMYHIFDEGLSEEEAASIMERVLDANNLRDEWMLEQVNWILAHEEKYYGREAILVTGHNAHITKDNGSLEHQRLGEWLYGGYGEEYYAIGTDFGTGGFVAVKIGTEKTKAYRVKGGSLAEFFHERSKDEKLMFVEFAALEGEEFFHSPQRMHTLGGSFDRKMQRQGDYLIEVIPSECYDALLYFPQVNPISVYNK